MSTRSATTDLHVMVKGTIKHQLDDGWVTSVQLGGWLLRDRLQTGIEADQANRGWQYDGTIASGDTLDIDLHDMASLDMGGGAGRDGLGQVMDLLEVVALIIHHDSGAGSLEVMATDPANKVAWVPTMTVANGAALEAGGCVMFYQPDEDAFAITDASSHILRLGANGGDVDYRIFVTGRHDVEESSSTSTSRSSSSTSSISYSSQSSSSSSSSSSTSSSSTSSSSSSSSSSCQSEVMSESSSSSSSSSSCTSSSSSSSTSSSSTSTSCSTSVSGGPFYTVTGPASAELYDSTVALPAERIPAAATFTVTLANGDELSGSVVITPSTTNGDGTFVPTSVTISQASPIATFTYQPSLWGYRELHFSNDRGLNDEENIGFMGLTQAGRTYRLSSEHLPDYANAYTPDMGGYLPFGSYSIDRPLSIINKDIREDELDPDSDAIIGAYSQLGTYLGFPEAYGDYGRFLNVTRNTAPMTPLQIGSYWMESDPGPFRIEPDAASCGWYDTPPATSHLGYDQHLISICPDDNSHGGQLYELYEAYTGDSGATFNCSGAAEFNCATGALRPDGWTSADGAGMPIYPLLLRYDEVARAVAQDPVNGFIPHALRFTVSYYRNWSIWPARHAGGFDWGQGVAWGARVRLKDSAYQTIKSRDFPTGVPAIIVNTLWRYGMYMNDGGTNWSLDGTCDARWNWLDFYQFTGEHGHPLYAEYFECLKMEYGISVTGPSTATVGQPCVYTVSRIPAYDTNFSEDMRLRVNGVWIYTPGAGATMDEDHPTVQLTYTPTSTGTYSLEAKCLGYWRFPDPITLVVT